MNIYVSNISFHTTEETLIEMFSHHGEVKNATILKDAQTGITRGFGFVEMTSSEAALEAIKNLDGREIQGRALRVSQAKSGYPDKNRSYSVNKR